ncbi:MAG: LPS-assembly protein LptD [Bacteroidales bacterium]|nr:LPS-assembly protein LptD [Bacteroidales bacterium]
MTGRIWRFFIAAALLMLLLPLSSDAQRRNRRRGRTALVDTTVAIVPDSVRFVRDSIHRADSIARRDSIDLLQKSSLERPAFSTARDSIVEVFSNGQRKIFYYGDVTVTYKDMTLKSEFMEYDMNTGTVYAHGIYDSLTGEWKGRPEMTQGSQNYKMEELRYNFDTQKARITNMITKEDDGIMQGQNIKMLPDKSINLSKGMYTVCDLEHPHYYLKLSLAKVVTKPSQKTVFGPAYAVFEDVPIPIVGLPFGFIPQKPTRATGLLMPTFGEETARGFYLRDAGMYFVFGDYFDLSVTGSYYTLGSWSVDVNSRYKVNYKFNGSFSFTYSNDQTGEKGSADFFQTKNLGVRWSHSQDSKAHPGTSFSASVNFSSPSNSRYNSRSVNEALENQISSSISYSRNWNGKVNLSVNALHNQNSRDSSYTFTLPNITLSVTRFYPFKKKNRVGKEKFYEKISLGYSTSFQNRVNFKLREIQDFVTDEDGNPVVDESTGFRKKEMGDSLMTKLLDRMSNGMSHNFQIGLPSFTLFKYINVNPSVTYGMNWMFNKGTQTLEYDLDEDGNRIPVTKTLNGLATPVTDENGDQIYAQHVVTDPGKAFNGFGVTQTYSGSVSLSTRIYGMFNFGKHHKLQAIRHVISPSLSFSYSPEKGKAFNGWHELGGYYDSRGSYHQPSWYNIYSLSGNHNSVSPPGRGQNGSLNFSVGNNFEAKVRDLRDTTGSGSKKIKLIDQLNINGNYNFLADSLRLGNIGVTLSTSIFGKLGLSANASFDPYAVDEHGRKYNKLNIAKEGFWHALRLTNASASLSYAINGKGSINGNDGTKDSSGGGSGVTGGIDSYRRIYYHPTTGEYIPGGYLYYLNPNAPWSLNINYSFSYSMSYSYANNKLVQNKRFTQTIGLSGNLKLTPRLSIQATTGFDVMAGKLTTTQISATYDLHCFNIAVSWVPTGNWQSYSFRIAANAAALADLLRFKKSSSYWDN